MPNTYVWPPRRPSSGVPQKVGLLVGDVSTPTSDTGGLLQSASVDGDGWITAEVDAGSAQLTPSACVLWRVSADALKNLRGDTGAPTGGGFIQVGLQVDGAPGSGALYAAPFVALATTADYPTSGAVHGVSLGASSTTQWRGGRVAASLQTQTQGPSTAYRVGTTQWPSSASSAQGNSRARNANFWDEDFSYVAGIGDFSASNAAGSSWASLVIGVGVDTGAVSAVATVRFRPLLWHLRPEDLFQGL